MSTKCECGETVTGDPKDAKPCGEIATHAIRLPDGTKVMACAKCVETLRSVLAKMRRAAQ